MLIELQFEQVIKADQARKVRTENLKFRMIVFIFSSIFAFFSNSSIFSEFSK